MTPSTCPFPTAAFDRVICSEVLEHIPDDLSAMRELTRVLRPGGTMAITVPRFGPELINWALSDEYHNVPGGHIRIYRRSVLAERLDVDRPGGDRAPLRPRTAQPLLVAQVLRRHHQRRAPVVKRYHQLLVWDIMKKPAARPGTPSRALAAHG